MPYMQNQWIERKPYKTKRFFKSCLYTPDSTDGETFVHNCEVTRQLDKDVNTCEEGLAYLEAIKKLLHLFCFTEAAVLSTAL